MRNFKRIITGTVVAVWLGLSMSVAAYAAESNSTAANDEETSLWEKVKAGASGLYDSAKEKLPGAIETIKEKTPEVIEKVGDKVDQAQDAFSEYREAQEDEFWDWFEYQTSTNVTDDNQADINASDENQANKSSEEAQVEMPGPEEPQTAVLQSERELIQEPSTSELWTKSQTEPPAESRPTSGEVTASDYREPIDTEEVQEAFFEARDVVILILAAAIVFLGIVIILVTKSNRGPR